MSEKALKYTIPLREAFRAPVSKRAEVAVRKLKSTIERLTKVDEVVLDEDVNLAIWSRSSRKPPRRLSVKVSIEDGVAHVSLAKENE